MTDALRAYQRVLGSAGSVLAALAIALAAFASHAAVPESRAPLLLAATMAFGHGAMLAAVSAQARTRIDSVALACWLAGALLFSGSLAGRHVLGLPGVLAPAGGIALMTGWLLYAFALARR